METVKLVVEQHPDGFVAYPLGVRGVVVGEGDTQAEAVADAMSALRFHVATFGPEMLDTDPPLLDACVVVAELESPLA